ncbi:hypothetical protein CENSYa_0589 [Cenarchaeum symbiosum A]|uniref:UDP-N-acetyl-D-mannosaminuronate dehydrogenase n=1 Tax=Cenarchaeum symbiosum (strain A) TaxID=414004 RepID=A0RV55_CENSY|nr:hypothetical protein CENSYa_0589 [Cenarchaeum symbiosum A]
MASKDVVAGLGEIGLPIQKVLSRGRTVLGYDADPARSEGKRLKAHKDDRTGFLHVCIPFTVNFEDDVISLAEMFRPEAVAVHSTISPYTTERLQKGLGVPVIYSATRGVHRRMAGDLKRYTKFYAVYPWAPRAAWAGRAFASLMRASGVKTKKMSTPLVLELAKIVVDTSYYGWLISYAQISNAIAAEHGINYDEMWSFSDEIHKALGNRPKMYPGVIGGHCVIPNLELVQNESLDMIRSLNDAYSSRPPGRRRPAGGSARRKPAGGTPRRACTRGSPRRIPRTRRRQNS